MGVGGARFGTADFIGIYPVSAAFQPTCKFDFVASNMLIDPPGVREGASRGGEAGRGLIRTGPASPGGGQVWNSGAILNRR